MTLTRDESSTTDVQPEGPLAADGDAMVIAIAASSEIRVRLASLVTGHAPVLLAGSREEAMSLLTGSDPHLEGATVHHLGEQLASAGAGALVLEVDSDLRVATWRGRTASLSPLEHDVLQSLLAQVGRTCTFESLHLEVWGNDRLRRRANVWSVVKRLRRKLDGLGCPFEIQAVRGVGVRLVDGSGVP